MTSSSENYDFLVIGGGIAGLTYALEVADHGSVAVLFKGELNESSTAWAQGGIAAVTDEGDTFEDHIQDTLKAGDGLCDEEVVSLVVREGPECVERLIARGAEFDKQRTGYHLHQEGGHSRRRIFHSSDATGYEIQRALLAAAKDHPNIHFLTKRFAVDLITTHKLGVGVNKKNEVLGSYVLQDDGSIIPYIAKRVLVATGGAGKVYLYTSNPDVATGDGIAMCYRAGVEIANMEFFQFHPTCLFHPEAKNFLITEAMRGEGAKLLRANGESFMSRYHRDEELASRDVVARAIDAEMKLHGEEYVLLDITHRGSDFIQSHFPTIYERCLTFGYDISKEPIPVVPAAHYCCGGVVTDTEGSTSIEGLYVAGETSCTGLHGANRLASNSLLEGMVFSTRAAKASIRDISHSKPDVTLPDWNSGTATDSDEQVVITQNWEEIRRLMWNYVGIVRTDKRLDRALRRNKLIQEEISRYYWDFYVTPDLLELRNLSLVSELVIRSALLRKESRGLHYTLNYPEKSTNFAESTILALNECNT